MSAFLPLQKPLRAPNPGWRFFLSLSGAALAAAIAAGPALASPGDPAERFLASLDPAIAAESVRAGRNPREVIAAAAAAAGIDLSRLGADWFAKFSNGEFKAPAAESSAADDFDGYFVCEDSEWVRFAMPLGSGAKKADVAVQRDGKPLTDGDFDLDAAPDGRAVIVKVRNTGGFHKGALIRATCGGKTHSARRPPDEVNLSCETEIQRGPEKTRIVIKPKVEQKDPEGKDKSPEPGKGPGGEGKTDVSLKDDEGFFETLFKTLGNAVLSMGIGLGTGLLLNELSSGGSGHVTSDSSDGSYAIEVPNEAYDASMSAVRAKHPDYGDAEVAKSNEPVIMESRAAGGRTSGLRIASYRAIGGSVHSLKPGQTVVFRVEGAGSCPSLAETSVEIFEGGAAAGYMTVLQVTGAGTAFEASARMPSMASTLSGDLEACVRVPQGCTDRVPLRLCSGSVALEVSASIVKAGKSVRISLNNPSGGGIKGTLTISGPAHFASTGGQSLDVDTENSRAEYSATTTSEGTVDIRFRKK